MLSKYIPKRFAPAMIKHVIGASLFFPYIYSATNNYYYQDFILANAFAVLAMIFIFTSWKLDLRKNAILLSVMGILLIVYNVVFGYMNYHYHHWYGEQINTTIIFLFFMVLLMVKDIHALIDNNMIRSIIHMIVTSNVLAIAFRLYTGYNRIMFINDYLRIENYEKVMDSMFMWLYIYKSHYAFILLFCIAFCVVYRKLFRNLFTYLLSLGVLIFAMYLTDTYTSFAAAVLIFVGQFGDYLWKAKWWKKLLAAVMLGVPGVFGCFKLYEMIGDKRNILTLGSRTNIWMGSWELIKDNPNGYIGFIMGSDIYRLDDFGLNFNIYNCHNLFLNQMLRFSIPVGAIFSFILLLIFLWALKRSFSFTTFFTIIAFLIPLCMDYTLTNMELILFITILFIVYFKRTKNSNV